MPGHIVRGNNNNLRCGDDTVLIATSIEQLQVLVDKKNQARKQRVTFPLMSGNVNFAWKTMHGT